MTHTHGYTHPVDQRFRLFVQLWNRTIHRYYIHSKQRSFYSSHLISSAVCTECAVKRPSSPWLRPVRTNSICLTGRSHTQLRWLEGRWDELSWDERRWMSVCWLFVEVACSGLMLGPPIVYRVSWLWVALYVQYSANVYIDLHNVYVCNVGLPICHVRCRPVLFGRVNLCTVTMTLFRYA